MAWNFCNHQNPIILCTYISGGIAPPAVTSAASSTGHTNKHLPPASLHHILHSDLSDFSTLGDQAAKKQETNSWLHSAQWKLGWICAMLKGHCRVPKKHRTRSAQLRQSSCNFGLQKLKTMAKQILQALELHTPQKNHIEPKKSPNWKGKSMKIIFRRFHVNFPECISSQWAKW